MMYLNNDNWKTHLVFAFTNLVLITISLSTKLLLPIVERRVEGSCNLRRLELISLERVGSAFGQKVKELKARISLKQSRHKRE